MEGSASFETVVPNHADPFEWDRAPESPDCSYVRPSGVETMQQTQLQVEQEHPPEVGRSRDSRSRPRRWLRPNPSPSSVSGASTAPPCERASFSSTSRAPDNSPNGLSWSIYSGGVLTRMCRGILWSGFPTPERSVYPLLLSRTQTCSCFQENQCSKLGLPPRALCPHYVNPPHFLRPLEPKPLFWSKFAALTSTSCFSVCPWLSPCMTCTSATLSPRSVANT